MPSVSRQAALNALVQEYNDVTKLDINRGHSTARNTAIGVAIGAGAVLTTLAILIASLDD